MQPFRILAEHPDHFVLQNHSGTFRVATRGLSPEFIARIRAHDQATAAGALAPYRVLSEHPDHFIIQNHAGVSKVVKQGLSPAFIARIRFEGGAALHGAGRASPPEQLLAETRDHFVLRSGGAVRRIPKAHLTPAQFGRIRGLAWGEPIQHLSEGDEVQPDGGTSTNQVRQRDLQVVAPANSGEHWSAGFPSDVNAEDPSWLVEDPVAGYRRFVEPPDAGSQKPQAFSNPVSPPDAGTPERLSAGFPPDDAGTGAGEPSPLPGAGFGRHIEPPDSGAPPPWPVAPAAPEPPPNVEPTPDVPPPPAAAPPPPPVTTAPPPVPRVSVPGMRFPNEQKNAPKTYRPVEDIPDISVERFTQALPPEAAPYSTLILEIAKKYRVNPFVLAGIVSRESEFGTSAALDRPGPEGRGNHGHGDLGLAQISPPTWRDNREKLSFGPDDWKDPRKNLEMSAYLLKDTLRSFHGNYQSGVAGYNRGYTTVTERPDGTSPDYPTEHRNYGHDVLDRASAYKRNADLLEGAGH